MKTIITAAAATLFSASVSAADFYHGLDEGNSDLSTQHASAEDFAAVPPSIGDSIDRYQGLADGNSDLFKGDGSQSTKSTGRPDIYMNVSANPDLQF